MPVTPPSEEKVDYEVRPADKMLAWDLVVKHHYSGRCPGIKYAFALYEGGEVVGCVVYSIPASYSLCGHSKEPDKVGERGGGVCGPKFSQYVLELSRLVVTSKRKNVASVLVGRSLAALPNHVVVSYADRNVGHVGYVYQATNWLYTGQGAAEPLWVHPRTHVVVSHTRRWIEKKAAKFGLLWTELRKVPQLGKHRYVYFTGDRRFVKKARKELRYPVLPYPKGDTRRHDGPVLARVDGPVVEPDTSPPPPTRLR